ncbi:hypothetical protein AQJ91_44815 [Streptomyces dysideae]|uniref:Uncharacterized protein n=1 Tax=Streptomyces dysideae TaxID=909626 RepID=A0A101UQ26_9ACTN|nr:hypothetical protein AQJ91_44815 [Streptomyces dysideae]
MPSYGLVQVPGVVGQPAAVREQVGEGDLAGDPAVLEGEAGTVLDDRVVPGDGLLTHGRGDHGRCDRPGDRDELEDGVGSDLALRAGLPFAEALQIQHLVVMDHADGDTRHTGPAHGVPHDSVEPVHPRRRPWPA